MMPPSETVLISQSIVKGMRGIYKIYLARKIENVYNYYCSLASLRVSSNISFYVDTACGK